MAGLLAYAAAGGIQGAGEGVADVGKQGVKQQMDEGIEKLRNDYAASRQTAEFAHGEAMQAHQEQFQAGQTEKEITARGAVAGAGREQQKTLFEEGEKGKTERAHIAGKSRTDAAQIRADSAMAAATAKGNQVKPWATKMMPSTSFDPVTHMPTTDSLPLLTEPNGGALYLQAGSRLIRWNHFKKGPSFTEQELNNNKANKNIPADELNRLYSDPTGVVPAGRGAGMTNMENFERVHGFLPANIMNHVKGGGSGVGAQSKDESNEEAESNAPTESENEDNAPAQLPQAVGQD